MIDLEYGFLSVRYTATGIGHNDHGSYPTGVWHLALCATSEITELAVVKGDISEAPATDIAQALTAVAGDGWRAEETIQVAHPVGAWSSKKLLVRLARPSVTNS